MSVFYFFFFFFFWLWIKIVKVKKIKKKLKINYNQLKILHTDRAEWGVGWGVMKSDTPWWSHKTLWKILIHTCQLSLFCWEAPGFDGNLPVSQFLCCFFKTITHIRFISVIYYIPWNGVTLDNFLKFLFFFSSIALLPWCFWEKHFALCVQRIRCTATHTTCCKIIKYWLVWDFFFWGGGGVYIGR